jgi:hypothetical protein
MTTFTDALTRVSRAAAALAAAPTDPGAIAEYDFACHALDLARSTPHPAQVAALRELLDLVEDFADNDQRARYLLACDWGRANVRHTPADGLAVAEPEPLRCACCRSEVRVRLVAGAVPGCEPCAAGNCLVCGDDEADGPEPRWALPGDVARSKGLPTPAEALRAGVHGYGGADDYGWAPGYCWCGAWALEEGPEHPGKPCAGLTAIFGRPPRSHEDALRLAFLRGVDGSR